MLACWPGVQMYAPATWISWLRSGDASVRAQAVPDMAAGQWQLGQWTWRDTSLLSRFSAGDYFSVHQFLGGTARAGQWYVNFELPYLRTPIGIDSFDLLLDLVVDIDTLGYQWKDEDEYAHGRRLGVIADRVHAEVEQTRARVLALIAARQGPFMQHHPDWQPDPGWRLPVLPPDALDVPAGR